MSMSKFITQFPLFDNCNLNCDFCVEHCGPFNKIDYDYIENIGERFVKEHEKAFKTRFPNVDELEVGLCGGELFAVKDLERLKSSLRIMQIEFIRNIHQNFPKIKTIHWNWTSNLVLNDIDPVIKFFIEFQGDIHTSYDIVGRFKDLKQVEIWKRNLKIIRHKFGKRFVDVCFVFTKPNIEAFVELAKKDPNRIGFHNAIPKDVPIDLSYYVPVNDNCKYLTANDDLVYKFFDTAIKLKMFNCIQVRNVWNTVKNTDIPIDKYCLCFDGNTWMDRDYNTFDCFDQLDKNLSLIKPEHRNLVKKSMDDPRIASCTIRGCYTCEYSHRCQKMCYMMVCNKYYKVDSVCPLYRIYRNIEEGVYDGA